MGQSPVLPAEQTTHSPPPPFQGGATARPNHSRSGLTGRPHRSLTSYSVTSLAGAYLTSQALREGPPCASTAHRTPAAAGSLATLSICLPPRLPGPGDATDHLSPVTSQILPVTSQIPPVTSQITERSESPVGRREPYALLLGEGGVLDEDEVVGGPVALLHLAYDGVAA